MLTHSLDLILQADDLDYVRKVADIFASRAEKRFHLAVRQADAVTSGVPAVVLEERADFAEEAYQISTVGNAIRVTGKSVGLLYGVGRLLHEMRRVQDGVELPELQLNETPTVVMRGIYLPMHYYPSLESARAFNAFTVLFMEEERLDYLEDYLAELMLWGMNTVGIWYAEVMDFAWDSDAGRAVWEKYARVLAVARGLRLKIYLLTTVNCMPPRYIEAHPEWDVPEAPHDLWAVLKPDHATCLSHPESRQALLETRKKLLELFMPCEGIDIFPTDPGGCGCAQCTPYAPVYYQLAEEMLRPAAALGVPLRSINCWYFKNADVRKLIDAASTSDVVNAINVQVAWKESTPERLQMAAEVADAKKIIFWPDITMIGNWGMTGAYPYARGLQQLFRLTGTPYGVLPYTEGRYDDLNKYFMLSLAWNPRQSVTALLDQVLPGAFGQAMPAAAREAMRLLERNKLAAARKKLAEAEKALDQDTRESMLWTALNFYARYGDVLLFPGGQQLREAADELEKEGPTWDAPSVKRAVATIRRRINALEPRIRRMAAELPGLCEKVNEFRTPHDMSCGTKPFTAEEIAEMVGIRLAEQVIAKYAAQTVREAVAVADTADLNIWTKG